ncbi:MAG: D-alanyl-lipoteichoic acid biosynthesis protein DltD [Chloroflexota bacterium]
MPIHLLSAGIACLFLVSAIGGMVSRANAIERQFVHTPAARALPHRDQTTALQTEAFRQPDLLPIYGSSELQIANKYRGVNFFHSHPTGFTIYPTGDLATSALIWTQALASVGDAMQGRKLVFSVSPQMFFRPMIQAHFYAGNFSQLHATSLAFHPRLSAALKTRAAQRMLDYPETLTSNPLLRDALERLAHGALVDQGFVLAAQPLGAFQNLTLRLQDHWDTLGFLPNQGDRSAPPARQSRDIDWSELKRVSMGEALESADNNDFGFHRDYWTEFGARVQSERATWTDERFLAELSSAREWTDLDLLLQAVGELGGKPLILSMPIHGAYYDHLGVSRTARQAYYDRLRQVAQRHNVPLVDFEEFDSDRYFLRDPHSHPSEKGWIHMNHILDAFYHDRLPAT